MLVSIFFNYFSNNIWWKGHCMSLKCVTYKLYQKGCPYRRWQSCYVWIFLATEHRKSSPVHRVSCLIIWSRILSTHVSDIQWRIYVLLPIMKVCLKVWHSVKVYTELRNLNVMDELSRCRPWERSRCRLCFVNLTATQLVFLESSNWNKNQCCLCDRYLRCYSEWFSIHSL
jgi:hypothetical protein